MGLKNLHQITKGKKYVLRVRLTDQDGVEGEGTFDSFDINKEVKKLFYRWNYFNFNLGPIRLVRGEVH